MNKLKYTSFLKPLVAHICNNHFSQTSHMAGPSERQRQLQGHMEKSWVQGGVNNAAVVSHQSSYTSNGAD